MENRVVDDMPQFAIDVLEPDGYSHAMYVLTVEGVPVMACAAKCLVELKQVIDEAVRKLPLEGGSVH